MDYWIEKSYKLPKIYLAYESYGVVFIGFFIFILLYLVMNFKNNVIPSLHKPQFTWYENKYARSWSKKSVSWLVVALIVVCFFALLVLVLKNIESIGDWFAPTQTSTTMQLAIGEDVSLSGTLQANGDLISYTHTLTLADATVIGLKSRTIDLSLYSGMVDIQWMVEKELSSVYIIEVSFVSWALASTWLSGQLLGSGSGIYMPQAGIYLPAEFGEKYMLLDQWTQWVFSVQNIATNQIVTVSYFACTTLDPNKNCTQLQKNISSSAEKTVSTSYGTTLYKLEGITSWFFVNGNNYGYFINDVPEQEVLAITDAFILPNDYYLKNTLLSKIQTLCTDGTTALEDITTRALSRDTNGLVVQLQWPTADGSAICKVALDPSLAAWWVKISYVSNTPTPSEQESSTPSLVSHLSIDTSVKQFPISLEKTMIFTSSTRWYTITFPSMNIAYEAMNVDEDLDLPGVRCSTQMNITKYADKATMNDNPKVRIFGCTIQGTLNNLGNSIIQRSSLNDIQFLIQILDPAWADFANNIIIQ